MSEDLDDAQQVSRRYRQLAAEQPSAALDDAILAAARRAGEPWTRRWAVPLSLAAVVVLSVAVTLRIQQEQGEADSSTRPAAPAPSAQQPAPTVLAENARSELKLKAEQEIKSAAPVREQRAKVKPADEPKPFKQAMQDQLAPAAAPAAPAPPAPAAEAGIASRADQYRGAESSVAGALARQTEERTARDAEAASRAPQVGPVQALAKRAELAARPAAQAESPERELERIAQLRRDGRHDEADKALAEFRKRHPDYKIPEPMLERVERR